MAGKIKTKTLEEYFINVMEGVDPCSKEDTPKFTENKEKYLPPCDLSDNLENLVILYKIKPGLFIPWKWGSALSRYKKTGHLLPDMLKNPDYFLKTTKSDSQLRRVWPFIFIIDLYAKKPRPYASRRTMQVLQVRTPKECAVCHREFNPRRKNQLKCNKCKRKLI